MAPRDEERERGEGEALSVRCGMGALTAMAAAEEEEGRACGGVYWGLGSGWGASAEEREMRLRDERCVSEPSERE